MFDFFLEKQSSPGRGELARAALLQAGLEEFGRNNLEGARIREIAERAGQNVASISYYFGGKQELYHEVARGIVAYLRERLEPRLERAREFLEESGELDPERRAAALEHLKGLCRGLIGALLADERTIVMTMIILREQILPTEAFDIFYDGFISLMHTEVTQLVCFLRKLDPGSTEARLLAHSVLGQIFGFRAARESILRSAGLEKLDNRTVAKIETIVCDNLERLFNLESSRT